MAKQHAVSGCEVDDLEEVRLSATPHLKYMAARFVDRVEIILPGGLDAFLRTAAFGGDAQFLRDGICGKKPKKKKSNRGSHGGFGLPKIILRESQIF